ncbi:MAG: caspase family protein [Gammaproteobacteria bacterium]
MNQTLRYSALLLLLTAAAAAPATQRAVLVGISDYQLVPPLEGPLHDVALIRSSLVDHWQFEDANILTLTNEQATKRNILDAIASLGTDGAPGDTVFIYFSGHGTSAADTSLSVSIPTKTGALVPHDVRGVKTHQELLNRLIIGKRDLQPVLKQLDRAGFNVFIVVDACYSGNVIRDTKRLDGLPTRFLRLSDLLPRNARRARLGKRLKFNPNEPFPYQNVFSLSAAQEYETTQDIPSAMLKKYPTLDGKPHGAFTDSFARVLSGSHDGDIDGNKILTLTELSESVTKLMRDRNFSSTPQLLPRQTETAINLANQALFGALLEAHLPTDQPSF